jgi:uncharacterized Ntn-hydrolase superfamily protein
MTFSIVAHCPRTGQFGAAVASSSPAVAARCIRTRAGVGAVASQNVTDPSLGDKALDLMARGASAQQALDILVASAAHIDYRQLALVDAQGRSACFTGSAGLGIVASAQGAHVACAGNLLAHAEVPARMLAAFQVAEGKLAERLLLAMQAGQDSGGEAGPVHSAGLLVVDAQSWPVVDLRVDWAEQDPIAALHGQWKQFEPQVESYTQRALNPSLAPSYGVPGDI